MFAEFARARLVWRKFRDQISLISKIPLTNHPVLMKSRNKVCCSVIRSVMFFGSDWLAPTNPLSGSPTKWSSKLKQLQQPINCLSVFDHFVGLALKGLILTSKDFKIMSPL